MRCLSLPRKDTVLLCGGGILWQTTLGPDGRGLPVQPNRVRRTNSSHLPEIVDVLADRMEPAFTAFCIERYGGPLALRRTESPSSAPFFLRKTLPPNVGASLLDALKQRLGHDRVLHTLVQEHGPSPDRPPSTEPC